MCRCGSRIFTFVAMTDELNNIKYVIYLWNMIVGRWSKVNIKVVDVKTIEKMKR